MFDTVNKWLCLLMSLTYLGCAIFGGWMLNTLNRPVEVETTLVVVVVVCYLAFGCFISIWLSQVTGKYWSKIWHQ